MNKLESLLTELERLDKCATVKPWKFERINHDSGEIAYEMNTEDVLIPIYELNYKKRSRAKFDSKLIAATRNALPVLLKVIRLQQQEIQCLHSVLSEYEDHSHFVQWTNANLAREESEKLVEEMG